MKQTKRMRMNNKKRTRRQRGGWSFPWFGSKTQDDVPITQEKQQEEQVKQPQGMFSFFKLPEFFSNQTQPQSANNKGGKKSKRRRYKNNL